MDYDRKSGVSSFYGGRRTSGDALNRDFPAPARRDSSSSFFTGQPRLPPGAGYNRQSYFDAGRPEPVKDADTPPPQEDDGAWDVFADFNNAGPRYSTAFGLAQNPASYQPIQSSPGSLKHDRDDAESAAGPVELVTVPALGPEWKAEELRHMTRRGRGEDKADARARWWRAWGRGQAGLCGQRWLTRRACVFVLFALCGAVALVLAFTIPRVPAFRFNAATPLVGASGAFNSSVPVLFSRAPANFSFPAQLDVQVDTGANFLPLRFTHLSAEVYDLDSRHLVGTGSLGAQTVPAKQFSEIRIPLNFTYVATNDSDATWTNWYNACKSKALSTDGSRPGLRFQLNIDMGIAGLIGTHHTTTSVTDAPCPIELPQNAA